MSIVKFIVRRADMLSPCPKFYSFIMTDNEIQLFDDSVRDAHYYLEFGLGGSSLRAINKSKAKIYSVESSPDWIAYMRKYYALRKAERTRLQIVRVNIGKTREWGYPEKPLESDNFWKYSASVFDELDRSQVDLVLVDGRFRVACVLKTILECDNPKLKILIHDFWERDNYHLVLKYLNVIKKVDNIGLFEKKRDIDSDAVLADYEAYKTIAE